jgi:nucleoside-diphosphate-sugar epimerase
MSTKIFFIGATGFIGGSALASILEKKDQYSITALVRDEDNGKKLKEKLGLEYVIGTLDDSAILSKYSSESDVVINTAHADHIGAAKAIMQGLTERAARGGKKPIFIQTSGSICDMILVITSLGTGVLNTVVGEYGEYSDRIYSDDNMADINTLDPAQPHRDVDLEIMKVAAEGKITTAIVLPPLIYGVGTGLFNVHSQQIPMLIKGALKLGKANHVGNGKNVWNCVNVRDLAVFYALLLEKLIAGEAPTNEERFFFCESEEHNFVEITSELGKHLQKIGKISDATPVGTKDEDKSLYGEWAWVIGKFFIKKD